MVVKVGTFWKVTTARSVNSFQERPLCSNSYVARRQEIRGSSKWLLRLPSSLPELKKEMEPSKTARKELVRMPKSATLCPVERVTSRARSDQALVANGMLPLGSTGKFVAGARHTE